MAIDRTNIKDETPLVGISELRGVGGFFTITQVVNEVPNYINQGIESLSANTPKAVTFNVVLSDANYTLLPRWGFTASDRLVPVHITLKATTGFTVEVREACSYEWIAVKI
jgi:hypothetical protein